MRRELPLSQLQKRYVRMFRSRPQFGNNNIAIPYRVEGPFDERALAISYRKLLRRHPLLRASIDIDDDDPHIRITHCEPHRIDVVQASDSTWLTQLKTVTLELNKTMFNLQQPPLIRLSVVVVSDTFWAFVLCVHHIISDGLSIRVILRDLFAGYSSIGGSDDNTLEQSAHASIALHQSFVDRENKLILSLDADDRLKWWRARIAATVHPTVLGTPYSAPQRADRLLPRTLTDQLVTRAAQAGLRETSVLTAAAAAAIPSEGPLSLFKRVIVRRTPEMRGLVDNTLDMQFVCFDRCAPLDVQARGVESFIRTAFANDLPAWWLVDRIHPDAYLDRTGPANIEVNVFVPIGFAVVDDGRVRVSKVAETELTVWPQYDYCFIIQPMLDQEWKIGFIYNPKKCSATDAEMIIDMFSGKISQFAFQPDACQ